MHVLNFLVTILLLTTNRAFYMQQESETNLVSLSRDPDRVWHVTRAKFRLLLLCLGHSKIWRLIASRGIDVNKRTLTTHSYI